MAEDNGQRPGLLTMAGAVIRAPFERIVLSEARARHERLQYEVASKGLEEVVRYVQPDPDEISLAVGLGDRELDQDTAQLLQQRAIDASLKDGHCVGYLRSLARFTIGEGPTFTPLVDDDLRELMTEVWEDFKRANDWDNLEDEIPNRMWRDGEFFLRAFDHKQDGPPAGWEPSQQTLQHLRQSGLQVNVRDLEPDPLPAGTVLMRLIPPDQIADPRGVVSHGILTSARDVCTVLGYMWSPPDEHGRPKLRELIPANEIRHKKIRVDQDVKRGRSMLEPLLKRAKQYDQWVEHRLKLNLIRTAFSLFKKVAGSAAQVAQVRSAQSTDRESLNDNKAKRLRPGSTVVHGQGIEYDFKGPNLQAQDARHDGRMLQLAMAAPTGMPEYMFTGDASNANFSSTMVAESPAVREFEDQQDTLTPEYGWVYRRAMLGSVRYGKLRDKLDETEVWSFGLEVVFPPMVARDELKHTQANEVRHRNDVLSKEGWATDEGIDYETEKARIAIERMDDVEFGVVVPPTGDEQ